MRCFQNHSLWLFKTLVGLFLIFPTLAYAGESIEIPDLDTYRLPLNQHYEIFIDKEEALNSSNFQSMTFEKTSKVLFGILPYPLWLRIKFKNSSDSVKNTSIWLKETSLFDYLEAFDGNGFQSLGVTGGLIPYQNRIYKGKDLVIPLTFAPKSEREIYLKIRNRNPVATHFFLTPIADYERDARVEYIIYSLLFGAILINMLYNLLLFLRLRELTLLFYVCYLGGLSILFLAINGMGAQFWGAHMQLISVHVGSIITGIFLLLFTKEFLQLHKYYPYMRLIYRGLFSLFLTIFAIVVIFPQLHIGPWLLYLDIAVITYFIYSMILGVKMRFMPAYAFAAGWCVFFAGALMMILAALAIIPPSFVSAYGMHLGAFVQMAFLSLATADRIRDAQNEINRLNERRNAELEETVLKRTEELRLILDNVKTAFFRVDANRIIQPGFTKSCRTLMGKEFREGMELSAALHLDPKLEEQIELVLQQIFEDVMPERVTLSLMPHTIKIGDRDISVLNSLVRDSDRKIRDVIFILDDATDYVKAQKQREVDSAIIAAFQQKSAFLRFVSDFKDLIRSASIVVRSEDQTKVRAILHTIKGNASIFNLTRIIELVHEIEDKKEISQAEIISVEDCMRTFINTYMKNFGIDYDHNIEDSFHVHRKDIQEFKDKVHLAVELRGLKNTALSFARKLCKKTVADLLGPVDLNVLSLASRLGKEVVFELKGGSILVDQERVHLIFMNLIHLVRNSLDHGIESSVERQRLGKPPAGSIVIEVKEDTNSLIILVIDDGRGIDPKAVADSARQKGLLTSESLQNMNEKEIQSLIFHPRLSTSTEITYLSGRGIGMSAVADIVIKNGASIDFVSKVGQGTTFKIVIPHQDILR